MLSRWSFPVACALTVALGCSSSSSAPSAIPTASSLPDACAADAPWLAAILGDLPDKSSTIHLDRAARDPLIGLSIARGEGREMDGDILWMRKANWASQESYQYDQAGSRTPTVHVLRQVSGKDPRTLGDFGSAPAFGAAAQLPSGVFEYPANPALASTPDAKTLFVFPDATWVFVENWMAPRFRAVFERTSASPPLPPGPPDVYVEYCFPQRSSVPGDDDGSKTGGVTLKADHESMRFLVGKLPAYEMLYTFPTPELAVQAEQQQRAKCAASKCTILSGGVEGRLVRYMLR